MTTVSSTVLLHVVSHPYVERLYEVHPESVPVVSPTKDKQSLGRRSTNINAGKSLPRQFRATRFNLLGNLVSTDFTLAETSKDVINPFASFQINHPDSQRKEYFYIFGGNIKDNDVKSHLTK